MPKVIVTDSKGLYQESGTGVFIEGGDNPGYIALTSDNGTVYYLFVDDNMDLKIHTAAPTGNGDGTKVGTQS